MVYYSISYVVIGPHSIIITAISGLDIYVEYLTCAKLWFISNQMSM